MSLAIVTTPSHQQLLNGGGVRAEDSFWFAVQTKPRHEKKVNVELREKGIHSFLPLHREKRQWSDRQQWIESPLFSQYVFVRVPTTIESRTRVLQTRGIVQFVGAPGRGTPIPDEQIKSVQAITEHRIPMTPHEFLRVGTRVRIRGGVLNGIEGVLAAIKNDRSLVVSVDLIQKSVAIRIDGFAVEPA
ncbi:MAG TPA: UpxY family transcription antiterminator [Candidatus Acidoferrum sp.]